MDSHIVGPRGGGVYGAVVSAIAAHITFGDDEVASRELFRTAGASATNPLFLRVTGKIVTAFDATGEAFKIHTTDLDGGGAADIATLAGLTAFLVLTSDVIVYMTYVDGTDGTAGEAAYLVELVGPGQAKVNL